jgi:hypothetical protein
LILAELKLSKDRLSASYVPEETVPYVVHHLSRVTGKENLLTADVPRNLSCFYSQLASDGNACASRLSRIQKWFGHSQVATMLNFSYQSAAASNHSK